MAVVTESQVQQWLGEYKIAVDNVDNELENTAKTVVFSALSKAYTTSDWTNLTNTPKLVQQVMSMYIAAWMYARVYSEDETALGGYAAWLEAKAQTLLDGIANGNIDLAEIPGVIVNNSPSFFPMDNSVEADGYTPVGPKFGMGSVY